MYGPRSSKTVMLVSISVMMLALSAVGSASESVEFGEVVRVSPAGRLAMSPDLIVDATGQAHILWVDKGPDGTVVEPQDPEEIESAPGMKHDAFDDLYYQKFSPAAEENPLGEPVRVNTNPGEVWGFSVSKPQLKVGPDGTVHVMFTGNQNLGSGKSAVIARYTRSTDAGQSFEPVRTLNSAAENDLSATMHGGFAAAHAFGTLLATDNGDVHVYWIDTRLMDESDTAAALFATVSRDGGKTFAQDQPVFEDSVCPCCQLAADSTDDVIFLASRQTYTDNYRDAAIAFSTDQGGSFGARIPVGEGRWQIEGCPLKRIDVAAHGNYVYTASYTRGREPAGVYLSRSTDAGATYEEPLAVHADARVADSPAVAADGEGRVYVVWHAKVGGPRRLYLRVSTDNGGSWSAPIEVPTPEGKSAYPEIGAAADGMAYIVWQQDNAIYLQSVTAGRGQLAAHSVAE
jgi:hypothetical protein